MTRYMLVLPLLPVSVLTLALTVAAVPSHAADPIELDEALVRIEINATDGDAGFHGKVDGEGWKRMEIRRPDDMKVIYSLRARRNLRQQGVTENFFESTEPTCEEQPLGDFLLRFPEGTYKFQGVTNDAAKNPLVGQFELSHALPAAPDISSTDGSHFEIDDDGGDGGVAIVWGPGDDLGECHDQGLVDDGIIPDPAEVEVDRWEVVVEPNVDVEVLEAAGLPLGVFSVQLAPGQMRVTASREYFLPYVAEGITDFKFEVGSKADENQTFSEGEFTVTFDG